MALFLLGCFPGGIQEGQRPTKAFWGNGPLRSENGPLRRGHRPFNGLFRAPQHGGKRLLYKAFHSELDLSPIETKTDDIGLFWSANRNVATPDRRRAILQQRTIFSLGFSLRAETPCFQGKGLVEKC